MRRPLFWILTLPLLLIVLVIGLYVVGHYLNEGQLDRQREAIGSFVAPTGWEELTHPNYVGPFSDSFCMSPANTCNYHHSRTWKTAEPPSATALRAMAEASGWKEIEFSAKPGTNPGSTDAVAVAGLVCPRERPPDVGECCLE